MRSRRTAWLVAALALTVPLAAAGCGDDDDEPDAGAATTATTSAAEQPSGGDEAPASVPSTGVEAAPPDEATACLEDAGFRVDAGSSAPPELREATGIEDQLTLATEDAGAGTITWYATEEQALEANKAESEGQSELGSESTIGRKGKALYVFAGSGAAERGRAILGCL